MLLLLQVQLDAMLQLRLHHHAAEVLSYPRTHGVFAGVSLEGTTIRPDNDANEEIYGHKVPARDIVLSGCVAVPSTARQLVSTLDRKTLNRRR